MANGPVEASMQVYEDFFGYTSGVYEHINGSFVGGLSVRLIGWGTANSTSENKPHKTVDYWLAANSW